MHETFGQRLRRLRQARGLSQRALAEPGITYAHVSRLERDERHPSMKALRLLSRRLGVTVEYLETGSPLRTSEARELELSEAELQLRLEGRIDVAALDVLLAEADAEGDRASVVRARIALGLAAAAAGDHATAIARLAELAATGQISAVTHPEVCATLGRAYAASGEPRQAVELFREGLAELERAGDNLPGRIRFSTYLSYALTDLGRLDEARLVVEQTLAAMPETTDPYTQVRLYWSAGRVAQEQARPHLALQHFRRAVALLEATEDTLHLARAHLSCAGAMIAGRDDLDGALDHLDRAESLLSAHASADDLVVIQRMRALRAARAGDYASGVEHARAAIAAAERLPNERAQATWALAEALGGLDDPEADDAFRRAAALLREHGTVRERAHVLRAYADHLERTGDAESALRYRSEADALAAHLALPEAGNVQTFR